MSEYPKRRSDVKDRPIEGERVVLDHKENRIHYLNRTASYIWERCNGKSTVTQIAREVAEAFEADAVTIEPDVAATVRDLEKAGLLEVGAS